MLNIPNPYLSTIMTSAKVSESLYLLFDHLSWISKIGLIKEDGDFETISSRYLLYSRILTLIKNLYHLQIICLHHKFKNQNNSNSKKDLSNNIANLFFFNKSLSLEIIKNVCDVCLSLGSTQKISISTRKLSVIGMISSLLSLYKLKYKLYPYDSN